MRSVLAPDIEPMTVSDLGRQVEQVVGRVGRGEARVIVEADGTPIAAIVSLADLDEIARLEREEAEDWAAIDELRRRNIDRDPDQVLADVTAVVEEVRREMYEEDQRATANGG